MKKFLTLSLSDVVFIMLINVKMPAVVGILTFMSMINFMLSWVEHGKSFITSGPGIIRVYCICFFDKVSLEYIWIYAADMLSRQHFLDKKIAGQGIICVPGNCEANFTAADVFLTILIFICSHCCLPSLQVLGRLPPWRKTKKYLILSPLFPAEKSLDPDQARQFVGPGLWSGPKLINTLNVFLFFFFWKIYN